MNKKICPLDLTFATDELKRLMAEHPDYPIVILASEDANSGDFCWMYCSSISFSVGEILDCETPFESEYVLTDRIEFEERLEEWLWDNWKDQTDSNDDKPPEDVFQKELSKLIADFEPFWKNVIEIRVGN